MKYAPPPYFSDPVLVDEIIQDFQTALTSDLSAWLLYVYPKARIGIGKDAEGAEFTYPQVYKNDGSKKYLDVRPNSDIRSLCFFEVNDPSNVVISGDVDGNTYDLSLVVWGNLTEIDSSRSEDFTSELIADVINSLNGVTKYNGQLDIDVEVEINPENAFSKYDLSQADTQFMQFPFTGFKINFTVTTFDDVDCIDTFVPGTPQDCQKLDPDSLLCQVIKQSPDQDIIDCLEDSGKFAVVCASTGATACDAIIYAPPPNESFASFRTGDEYDMWSTEFQNLPTKGSLARVSTDRQKLLKVNVFGHLFRFTGTTGGYWDASLSLYKDVNGVTTTRAGAFPSEYLIDHYTGLGWSLTKLAFSSSQNIAIDTGLAHTAAGFSDFYLASKPQMASIQQQNSIAQPVGMRTSMGWTPFDDDGVTTPNFYYWTSTRRADLSSHGIQAYFGGSLTVSTSNDGRGWAVRRHF